MEYQDLNLKRQVFSKDSIKGKLIVDSSNKFYLPGTSSGNVIRGINYSFFEGNQYVFWVNNNRFCIRAKINVPNQILQGSDLLETVYSPALSQDVSGDAHLPLSILLAFEIGKVYFRSGTGNNNIMEFDYDMLTHTFSFVGLVNTISTFRFTGWTYINDGSELVVYRNDSTNNIDYYSLSVPYDLSTATFSQTATSSISPFCEPFFYNQGRNFYVYSSILGNGQFDLVCGRTMAGQEYKLESSSERYRVEFNRMSFNQYLRPMAYNPFLISDDRKHISFPHSATNGGSYLYGEFSINGKFNAGLEIF